MKAVLVVLALVTAVHHRIAFVLLGQPVPVLWLLAAAEILAGAGAAWLVIRVLRRSCSRSFPRLMRSAL